MKKLFKNLKKINIFLKDSKKELIIVLIFSILTTMISVIIPSTNGSIINNMLNANYQNIIFLVVLVGLLHIFNTIFDLFISKNYLTLKRKIILNIRKKVCRTILNLNLDICTSDGQGTIMNKLKSDSKEIVTFLNSIKESLLAAMANVGVLIYIFYLNYIIGLFYLIAIIFLLFIQYYGIKKSIYYKKKVYDLNDDNSTLIGEIVKGVKDIKILKLKDKFLNKTDNSFEKIAEYEYRSNIYLEYAKKISKLIGTVFSGLIVIISIFLIKNKLLTTSNFIMIFMYRGNIFNFSNKLAIILDNLEKFNLSIERIFSILDYNKEEFGIKNINNLKGNVLFKNVDFSYGEESILNKFNLEIKANSFTVIIGKNGAGKSTLLSLLTKIVKPSNGEIYLDDYKMSELTEDSIRDNVSLVTQQPYIFNFSIKGNFTMIDENLENIKQVCKLVGIDKKIESLENGYDTKLREDASNLSGGEKQKLAIARALLANTKILLLDEITNNLDTESVKSIKKIMEKLQGQYTIIMVTHNLDMVTISDRVIVMENGKIVGDGTHKKLLKENKYYQTIYKGNK